jgi:predicted RNA-binding protein with PIN domain
MSRRPRRDLPRDARYNSDMALLIDGYNLLHVTGIFGRGGSGTALHRSREALLNFLAAAIDDRERAQTTIVFDAAGAPPGLPRTVIHQDMTVHFARGYPDADEMIEELIEGHRQPQSLVVVSGDHRVQRAARRRKATLIDSDRWFGELLAARREASSPPAPPAKPVGSPTTDEVAYWLDKFAQPLSEDGPSQARDRWSNAADENAPPAGADRACDADDKPQNIEPDSDLANPFPPGYAEDLLDGDA